MNNQVTYEIALMLKEHNFDLPVAHAFVHETKDIYNLEYFTFYKGTSCPILNEVFDNEKHDRNLDNNMHEISNESEVFFNYNQDIRKLITKIYHGEEYSNDIKCLNFYMNSHAYEKLTYEEIEELKIKLPNYNDGDFDFCTYQDTISAPNITEVLDWIYKKYNVWIFTKKEKSGFQSYIQYPNSKFNWFSHIYHNPKIAYYEAFEYILIKNTN